MELAGAAAGEDGARAGVDAAAQMRPEGVQVQCAVRRVRGHREEQRSVEAVGELVVPGGGRRRVCGHGLSLACADAFPQTFPVDYVSDRRLHF
ncbi:hypothetical protein O1L44_26635 [Streptomyces noursei]|nr:hypothetical protein [Streptomyces noursei]